MSDGPFTESKEIVGGFWMLQFKSQDEAVAMLSRCPTEGGEMIELRRVYEAEDFGAELTPELQEQEQRLRDQVAAQQAGRK